MAAVQNLCMFALLVQIRLYALFSLIIATVCFVLILLVGVIRETDTRNILTILRNTLTPAFEQLNVFDVRGNYRNIHYVLNVPSLLIANYEVPWQHKTV